MKKGFVVSDMHMFSQRSTSARELPVVEQKIAASDVVVFNGDIFDFRWNCLGSISEAVVRAAEWLEGLLRQHPKTVFYFICGNHDSLPAFRSRLTELASKYPNLHWHPYYIRTGPHLFLHGDVVDSSKYRQSLDEYRRSFHGNGHQGLMMNLLYRLLIASQLHKIIFFVHKKERIAPVVLEYLRAEPDEVLDGVRNIFLGHTHVPFEDYVHEGISFHNSGSMIRGLPSRLFEFTLED